MSLVVCRTILDSWKTIYGIAVISQPQKYPRPQTVWPAADLKCQPCSKGPPTWARCRSSARTVSLKRRSLLSPHANLKGEAGGRCDGMSSSRRVIFPRQSKEWSTSCLLSRCHGDRFVLVFFPISTPTGLLHEIPTEAAEEHPLSLFKCQWPGVDRLWNQWWRNGRMLSGGGVGAKVLDKPYRRKQKSCRLSFMFRLSAPHAGN